MLEDAVAELRQQSGHVQVLLGLCVPVVAGDNEVGTTPQAAFVEPVQHDAHKGVKALVRLYGAPVFWAALV